MTRTVTLELLRHGPTNNQLLSPLTPYLALCGNHDAETVNVGFEHLQMMRRLRQLRYVDGRRAARTALLEASVEVSRLVASIRSLTADMSSAPRGDRRLVHLRLVLSASELALLPFELVTSPPGFPGRGQPLSLQTVMPIAITREVRRVTASTIRWPEAPRILVVAAAPRDVPPVPLRAHLLAIRRALAPWLITDRAEELAQNVTVLPRATLAQVREACATAAYTHVHVLAHGYEVPEPDDEARFGLAFHKDGDPDQVDVVTGSRLAAALRCHPSEPSDTELSSPAVVTVASCDSGNVGSVIAHGASVAHELHEAGIPLVLASQFPITTRGSAIMAELVYRRLLRGDDPRLLVHDLRQELHVASPDTHDWASIVAYAALPPDIDAQVRQARFQRARRKVDTVMARLDGEGRAGKGADLRALEVAMRSFEEAVPEDDTPDERVRAYGLLASAKKRAAMLFYGKPPWPILVAQAAAAVGQLEGEEAKAAGVPPTVPPPPEKPTARPPGAAAPAEEAAARSPEAAARAEKPTARPPVSAAPVAMFAHPLAAVDPVAMFAPPRAAVDPAHSAPARPPAGAGPAERDGQDVEAQRQCRTALDEARTYYLRAFRLSSNEPWSVVQWLALTAALGPLQGEAQQAFADRWTAARVIAEDNLSSANTQSVVWAHGALIELHVLAQLLPDGHRFRDAAGERAEHHVDQLLAIMATEPYPRVRFDAYSVLRQLERFAGWWWKGRKRLPELPGRLCEKLRAAGVQSRWELI